mmetsp:Transcript_57508/g.157921  ORF Transcript_57508/g.157921 Transcript_57508/m.157921 type:complete len:203 (+) Transcript_57508:442-1050(+)
MAHHGRFSGSCAGASASLSLLFSSLSRILSAISAAWKVDRSPCTCGSCPGRSIEAPPPTLRSRSRDDDGGISCRSRELLIGMSASGRRLDGGDTAGACATAPSSPSLTSCIANWRPAASGSFALPPPGAVAGAPPAADSPPSRSTAERSSAGSVRSPWSVGSATSIRWKSVLGITLILNASDATTRNRWSCSLRSEMITSSR